MFNALKGMGQDGRYTFPDQAQGAQRDVIDTVPDVDPRPPGHPGRDGRAPPPRRVGHQPRRYAGNQSRSLFQSNAHYYEPAGAVSWDVAMGGTPSDWRVQLQGGDS